MPTFTPLDLGGLRVSQLPESDRYLELDHSRRYWEASQHDHKKYDWQGKMRRAGPPNSQPLLTTETAPFYVPLADRYPCSPVRLGKSIVESFTTLVFGEDRFPEILCKLDADTQDFAQELSRSADLENRMIEARNVGGACGSVGLSWCFAKGLPVVEVHDPKDVWVIEWADEREKVPATVTEIYRYPKDEWDPAKGKMLRNWYWYRRDWDDQTEVVYYPVPYKYGREPDFTVDEENSVAHGFGLTPFLWVQNLPRSARVDGWADYDGLYDQMNNLDVTSSVIAKGTNLNLDPTLVLKIDQALGMKMGVKKGSDHALWVGTGGDAKYLELAGTSVEAGLKVKESERKDILETAQCVLPDPNEIAAAGVSSIALKAIYQPMLGKAGVLRGQYGKGLTKLLEQMVLVSREKWGTVVQVPGSEVDASDEAETDGTWALALPPKTVKAEPKAPEKPSNPFASRSSKPSEEPSEAEPPEEPEDEVVDQSPGEGEHLELTWDDWFPRTAADRSQDLTALGIAAGGKAIVSQQTAVEEAAKVLGRDPDEEWKRVQAANTADDAKQAEMFKQSATDLQDQGAVGKPNPFAKGGAQGDGGPREEDGKEGG